MVTLVGHRNQETEDIKQNLKLVSLEKWAKISHVTTKKLVESMP